MSPRGRVIGYLAAVAAVTLVSIFIGVVLGRTRLATISMLYLVAVMVVAVVFGRGPAVFASVAAFLAFDYFFVDPVHHFTIADPDEYISLVLFLLTAIVTGTLAALQRERAREAEERRREAVVLHDVARLLGEPDLDVALRAVAHRLAHELSLAVVAIQPSVEGIGAVAVGEDADVESIGSLTGVRGQVLSPGRAPTAERPGAPGRWVRVVAPHRAGDGSALAARLHSIPLALADGRLGTLVLLRRAGTAAFRSSDDRLLSAAASQIAQAIERARLRREATEAEILRRTDDLKSALLDAVSHELRTPLASILTAAGSLRQRDVHWSDEEREEFLGAVVEEAQRLDRLVGDLLDLSRIEAGTLRVEKGWYDVGSLVDDVVGRLRSLTAEHRVVVSVSDDVPPVELDYVAVDQVLSNLIENAAKYSPTGTDIEVGVTASDGAVRFEVADRGPGVPPGESEKVFRPFYRIGRDDRVRGTGVGLAVARRLVEAHGGTIRVEPRAGGGSRFVFALPMGVGIPA